jgi:hypothetical protein
VRAISATARRVQRDEALALEADEIRPAASGEARLAHGSALHWLLRLACVFEFVGHGAFGIITKQAWVAYYGVVGIPPEWAYRLMPLTGGVDIFLGSLVLLKPIRAALLYMALWGLWTALLRPLSGEPVWETIERAPNSLVPAAFLALRGLPAAWRDWRGWLR